MILNSITFTAPSGATITLGSLIAAGGDLYGYTLGNFSINPAPVPTYNTNLPLISGGVVVPTHRSIRTVKVSGMIVARTANEANQLRRQMIAVLREHLGDNVTVGWTVEDEPRQLEASIVGEVTFEPAGGYNLLYEAELLAADPVAYSTTLSSAATSAVPGTSVSNNGDADVWPTITLTFTGSVTSVRVGSTTIGRFIEVGSLTTTTGDELVIVTKPGYETVELNGASIMNKVAVASRFWYLKPGTNEVYHTVTAGAGSATGLVEWNDGWVS